MNKITLLTLSVFFLVNFSYFIDVHGQEGSRNMMEEYCLNNWQRDLVQCADYVPEDYEERKAEYQAQEAEKIKQETQALQEQESERVCPVGSHITTDNQGNQICVDSSGRFTGYPNVSGGLGNNETLIGIGVIIFIIVIAVIAIASRKKSTEDTTEQLPRRGWTDAQHKQILDRQDGKCAICGEYSGSFQFDHKDGNHYNNDIDNAQGLCPNCHDRKSRGLN